MVSYTAQVTAIHKKFQKSLSQAKSRQAVLNAYYSHKKDHDLLLKKHLKEEFAMTKKIKDKMDYK